MEWEMFINIACATTVRASAFSNEIQTFFLSFVISVKSNEEQGLFCGRFWESMTLNE